MAVDEKCRAIWRSDWVDVGRVYSMRETVTALRAGQRCLRIDEPRLGESEGVGEGGRW